MQRATCPAVAPGPMPSTPTTATSLPRLPHWEGPPHAFTLRLNVKSFLAHPGVAQLCPQAPSLTGADLPTMCLRTWAMV